MTDKLFAELWAAAQSAENAEAFAAEQSASPTLAPQLTTMWHVAHDPFRELLRACGYNITRCAVRYCIPYRTVQNWVGVVNEAPPYIRLMIAETSGLLTIRSNNQPSV